jgi:disulfide bond formation protein DsbB
MSVDTASLFFALLALACLAGVLALSVGWLVWRRSGSATLLERRADLGRAAVPLGWVVATVSTLGSLYYSEIADFVPCRLCWYQRICMYPLVIVLGVAAIRRDRAVRFYVAPLAAIGAVIAGYHSWIQAYPPDGGTSFCTLDAPCTERYVWEFGFVSLPLMALSGFLFILAMMALARPSPLDDGPHDDAGNFGAVRDDSPSEGRRLVGTSATTEEHP